MLQLDDVQELVLARCPTLAPRDCDLAGSLGRVLAEDVTVETAVPAFANTAMDGYALRAGDTTGAPVELRVAGLLAAGARPPERPLGSGEALQIMTGAPMPAGADAVAIVERTETAGEGRVRILDEVEVGANVRPAGSDMPAGSIAVARGTLLTPAHLGVLASVGRTRLAAHPPPRVGVMSTGDEVVEAGVPLEHGQVHDSNRQMLLALLRRDGFEPVDLGIVRDDEAAVTETLERALGTCDAVLSSGGVSKGEFDFVKVVLDRLAASRGGESFQLAVAIRPAKPLSLAWLPGEGTVAFFGLPGNPVSAMVSYQVVALPGLRRMAGFADPLPRRLPAVAGEDFRRRRDGRLNLLRVHVRVRQDGRIEAVSTGGQQSHQLGATSSANALCLVPDGDGAEAGAEVEVILLGQLGTS